MRILIDARLYGLENAGLGRYVINLIKYLDLTDPDNSYVVLLRKKYFDSLKLGKNWTKVKVDFRHYGFLEQLILPWIIALKKPDLVHFPHFNVPVLYSGKYAVTIHDMLMHHQKGTEATTLLAPVYYIKRMGYHFVFGRAIYGSAKIITPSRSVRDELVKEYKINRDKIQITYEGVDPGFGDGLSGQPAEQYIIYAGNAYPHKNITRLIDATVKLNNNYGQKINLLLVSARNIFTHRLEKLIKSMSAEKYVKLMGFVSDTRLAELYKNSLCFVFPSVSEGFGLPGLEAMTAGTLVVASDIPVFKEVYAGHAIYFNPKDSVSLCKAILTVKKMDKAKRLKRILSSQKYIKKYTWKKMAEQTLSVYAEAVEK